MNSAKWRRPARSKTAHQGFRKWHNPALGLCCPLVGRNDGAGFGLASVALPLSSSGVEAGDAVTGLKHGESPGPLPACFQLFTVKMFR